MLQSAEFLFCFTKKENVSESNEEKKNSQNLSDVDFCQYSIILQTQSLIVLLFTLKDFKKCKLVKSIAISYAVLETCLPLCDK